jgi:hypothetical protein
VEGNGAACHTGNRSCFYRTLMLPPPPAGETGLKRA